MQKNSVSAGTPQRMPCRNSVAPGMISGAMPIGPSACGIKREEGEQHQPQPQRQPQRLPEQRADLVAAAGAVELRHRRRHRQQRADRHHHRQPPQRGADGDRRQRGGAVVAGQDVVDEADQAGGHVAAAPAARRGWRWCGLRRTGQLRAGVDERKAGTSCSNQTHDCGRATASNVGRWRRVAAARYLSRLDLNSSLPWPVECARRPWGEASNTMTQRTSTTVPTPLRELRRAAARPLLPRLRAVGGQSGPQCRARAGGSVRGVLAPGRPHLPHPARPARARAASPATTWPASARATSRRCACSWC